MSAKNKADNINNNFISYVAMLLITLFMVVIPFYRGLYFRENYIPSIIYISGIFLFYLMYKLARKDYKIIGSYLDMVVLLLPVSYLLSFFFAVNVKEAFDSILKYSGYFMLYKLVQEISTAKGKTKLLTTGILFSIFLVALTGMMTMAGMLENKGITLYNRLYGVYQYPNTTGAVLGCGLLITFGLLLQETNFKWKTFYQMVLATIFPAFIFTMSLGSFLVFGIIALIYFIISSYRDKLALLLNTIATAISSSLLLMDYFKNALKGPFWLYYAAALIVGILLQMLLHRISSKYMDEKYKRRINAATAVIICIAAAAVLIAVAGSDTLQEGLSSLLNIDLKSQNASDRIIFTKDGLKIFADNFLTGAGGGAWKDIYLKYQSFPYISREAHNFYIQTMIETGIIGTVILISLLFLILKKAFRDIIHKNNDTLTPYYLGTFMILGHAALDFDLSLSAPMFLLWALIGVIGNDSYQRFQYINKRLVLNIVTMVLCLAILISSSFVYMGILSGVKAAGMVSSDIKQAEILYKKAMRMDKFNSAYRIDYAQILNKYNVEKNNKKYRELMYSTIKDVFRYEPYNIKYKSIAILLLLSNGYMEEGIEEANNLINIGPLYEDSYVTKAEANLLAAQYFLQRNKYDEAIPYLDSVIEMEQQIKAAEAWSLKPFEVSDKVHGFIEQAKEVKDKLAGL